MTLNFSTPPETIKEMAARIRQARAALEETINAMSIAERTQPGPDGAWSVYEHLAHLSDWRWKLLAMIEGRPPHEGLRLDAETFRTAGIDGINAILAERNRHRPPEEILADFNRSHQAVLSAVENLSDADLHRVYDLTDPTDSRELREGIISNTYDHDLEHLQWIMQNR